VTNGICGQPPAPFFNMPDGITAYPAATWGALARIETSKQTYMQFAAYDGDPNNGDDTHGANFGFGHNGVLFFRGSRIQNEDRPLVDAEPVQLRRLLSHR
jgi:carbohydrate-selective porin OprB